MTKKDNYQSHKDRVAARARKQSADSRDIGRIPRPKNWKRRQSCERNLRKFLLTYFEESFPLPFSEDHEEVIRDIERAVLEGGLKAIAMPRGSGKTTIIIRAAIWASAYGHRRFTVVVEADKTAAQESLDVVKVEWETNQLLLEDFPEIAIPIRSLEGITQRANAQTCMGERTLMTWAANELVYPTVRGSKASRAVFRVSGILGRVRGMQAVTADGQTIRPDLVLVNDPQTDTSARSEIECAKRERILSGAILGLAGPGKRIAGFAAVTVICEGDAADRMLNPKLNPKWHGTRAKLVYEWPKNTELWERYLDIRADEIAAGDDTHPKATAFYVKNRKAMDAGSKVGWEHRKFPHEVSAIQHAFGLRADNPDTFDAEYQNEPKPTIEIPNTLRVLSSDEYCLRVLKTHGRNELPDWTEHLTFGADIQESTIWWVLLATSPLFQAQVVNYGIWPDQNTDYITLDQCKRTYSNATKISRPAEALIEALNRLFKEMMEKRLQRDDGTIIPISKALIDSGYRTPTIHNFCSQTNWPVMPSKGEGVGAKQKPWDTIATRRGERMGFGWRIPPTRRIRGARHVLIDTNHWKTFVSESFAADIDTPGSWTLFNATPTRHRMFADNLAAEYPTETTGRGRTLFEWSTRPNRDNHFLDALILAGVAASMAGASAPAEEHVRRRRRRANIAAAAATAWSTDEMPVKTKRSLAELKEAARVAGKRTCLF